MYNGIVLAMPVSKLHTSIDLLPITKRQINELLAVCGGKRNGLIRKCVSFVHELYKRREALRAQGTTIQLCFVSADGKEYREALKLPTD